MKIPKNIWLNIAIFGFLGFLVFWAGKGLFRYSFYQTHDIKRQLVRGCDAVLTIREGHFPLRWAGFTDYECGTPTFNFYYPLFYYLLIIVNFFTGGVMLPIKLVSFLSLAVGSLFFYLWIKEETQNRWAAFASSVLYLYAPYRFLLVYVRGDPEYLSYAILPLVLYFFAKTFRVKDKFHFFLYAFLAAISGGLLAVSHNVVSVFVFPLILLYLLAKIIQKEFFERGKLLIIFLAFLSAFGIGAFFIVPAVLEIRFTQIATPIFNYKDHFPSLRQLLYSKWGYGDSGIGTVSDGLSFQLGCAHWLVLGLTFFWLFSELFQKKLGFRWFIDNILTIFLFVSSLILIYLMLPQSIPVWEGIGLSKILDFPWRLLGIVVFTISALFGVLVSKIRSKKVFLIVVFGILVLTFIGNRNYLLAQPVLESELSFYEKIDNFSVPPRSLPAYADNILPPTATTSCYLTTPVAVSNNKNDKVAFTEINRGSTYGNINLLNVDKSIRGDKVIFDLSYFPEFKFYLNGVNYNYLDCGGLVCIKTADLKSGVNQISWKIGQTKIEEIADFVSMFFIVGWLCIIIYTSRRYAK